MTRMEGGKVRNKLLTYRNAAQGEFHLGADVTDLEFRVWHVLLAYADKDGRNARPGMNAIITETRRSRSPVKRALKSLEEKGAIVCTDRGDGRGHASVYTVLPLPGATRPADAAPRFGARAFARVNTALRRVGCEPLDRSRWLDPDDPERGPQAAPFDREQPGPPADPFPASGDDGKGSAGDPERGPLGDPHQSKYQGDAAGRETGEVERNDSVGATGDRPEAGGPPAEQRARPGRGVAKGQQRGGRERWLTPVEPPPDPDEEEMFPEDEAGVA